MSLSENYIEVVFKIASEIQSSVLIALLSERGFEGFEEENNTLKCYISESIFNKNIVDEIAANEHIQFEINIIQTQNWNAVWEQNFEPVQVGNFVSIRAAFHPANNAVQHEIIITPKMSFGTGHHATTYMMIKQLQALDFVNKQVLDFGTGTGILSILAEKLSAKNIDAIDNDEWSIMNTKENIIANFCNKIKVQQKDNAQLNRKFDIVLANINKNIILENIHYLFNQTVKTGFVLLSGLLLEDEKEILAAAKPFAADCVNTTNKNQWISMLFRR